VIRVFEIRPLDHDDAAASALLDDSDPRGQLL
jgi:hypothetical protein